MNENLAEVIRRFEQERARRPGTIRGECGSDTAAEQNNERTGQFAPRRRPCGYASEATSWRAPYENVAEAIPRRSATGLPARTVAPHGLSALPGWFDADWMMALSRLNSVGLASLGCLACEMIGGAA